MKKKSLIFFSIRRIISLTLLLTISWSLNASWANETLKVGIFQNKPIVYHEDGAKGLFVEVLNYVAEKENWKIEYVPCVLKDCLNLLNTNEIDLMTSVGESPERLEHFEFSKESIWTFWGTVYSNDSKINGILDLKDKKIAVRKNNNTTQALQKLLDEFKIPVNYIEFDDYESAFKALQHKDIDAVAVNNTYAFSRKIGNSLLHQTPIVFNPFSAYFAVSKNSSKQNLLKKIDKHVKELKANKSSIYHAFERKWFGGQQQPYWTGKRVGIISGIFLIFAVLFMAAWRFRSIVRVNEKLTNSIMQQKRTEAELLKQKVFLQKAQKIGKIGSWELNIRKNVLLWTDENYKIFGLPLGTVLTYETFLSCVHPDDRDYVDREWKAAFDKKPYDITHRLVVDGKVKWVREKAELEFNENNECIRGIGFAQDITEQRQIEEELKEAEKKFRDQYEKAPLSYQSLDEKGNFIAVNQTWLNVMGYQKHEVIGKNFSEFLHPDWKAHFKDNFPRFKAVGEVLGVEFEMVKKDGSLILVSFHGKISRDKNNKFQQTHCIFQDITKTKMLEEESEKNKTILMEAEKLAGFGGWFWDIENDVWSVSENWLNIHGNSNHRLTTEALLTMIHSKDIPIVQKAFDTVSKNGGSFNIEYRIIHQTTGEVRHIHTRGEARKEDSGKTGKVFGAAQDITERKIAEARLMQAQKMEAIGTLAGGIAHDFNNILFPIVGHTEMLLEDVPKDSPFKNSLNEIYTGALRARDLVKQILAFSRQGKTELRLMKIQPIVKEALKLIRSTIPTTISIHQDLHADCGPVKADPTQIHQVIMNLSTNAYHAMEESGGELKINLKEIRLGKYDLTHPDMTPGLYAHLTVADTGMGMDNNVIRKIFEPFFTTKEKGKGTGMGLSVVYGIVRGMNGSIQVHSHPGQGTEFNIYLPIFKNIPENQGPLTSQTFIGGSERILLVDDEDAIIAMEKQVLKRLGYQVTSLTSSLKALDVFKAGPDQFDLVITDMAMPEISGHRLAGELIKIRPDIPIVLCTGFSESMTEEKIKSIGIKGLLVKPIVIKDLAKKIREVLD